MSRPLSGVLAGAALRLAGDAVAGSPVGCSGEWRQRVDATLPFSASKSKSDQHPQTQAATQAGGGAGQGSESELGPQGHVAHPPHRGDGGRRAPPSSL